MLKNIGPLQIVGAENSLCPVQCVEKASSYQHILKKYQTRVYHTILIHSSLEFGIEILNGQYFRINFYI